MQVRVLLTGQFIARIGSDGRSGRTGPDMGNIGIKYSGAV